ncbi:MAG TPA: ABC transporter ATP-binding protein [Acidimicrobiales bacterium]|nr:ABC transporter ATP-binding protein [Acidimicrobiales bacterium]
MTAPVSGWWAGSRVARYLPRPYVLGGSLWSLNHCLPLVPGLLLKAIFDRFGHNPPATNSALSLLAVLAAVQVGRGIELWGAMLSWARWWVPVGAWIRSNLLGAVLCRSGPPSQRLPGSAGEAVGRMRDDVDDLVWLADIWVDVAGAIILGAIGVAVMCTINVMLTLVVVLPLVAVVFLTRWLSQRIRRYHAQLRQSGAAVTSFIADVFSSVQAIKTAGAEDRVLARFRYLNASRGTAAVKSELANTLLQTVSAATSDISIGLVLLLAGSSMRNGHFTVGDLALFTSYTATLTSLPRWTGRMLARVRAASVATERLARMVPEAGPAAVFAPGTVYIKTPPPPVAAVVRPAGDVLERLQARGLTASPVPGRRGIENVDLDIGAGEFVVVTGAIGAGKSTLVRALLGLAPVDAGTVRWNGAEVADPGLELVPPRVAYVAQVPRLFSAQLGENVTLGWPASADDVASALRMAAVDEDVAAMPDGLATLVGPRGMRLSGGQAQRTAAARAIVRSPDLLVVDDLASALDPHTEARLWSAIVDLPTACLAVSHRPALLQRADRIVVLDRGHVVGVGPLAALLDECDELRRMWDDPADLGTPTAWPSPTP